MSVERDKLFALAAVLQASALVKSLANTGNYCHKSFKTLLDSILFVNSNSVSEIYGESASLKIGFQEIVRMFGTTPSNPKRDNDVARYALSVLHLERRLARDDEKLDMIKQGIDRAKVQLKHFDILHENVIANLANIYTDTISTYKFRIHVTGNPNYLNNRNNANKVRALLLAAVRAAVLWRQLGGNRWHLIFARKNYSQMAAAEIYNIEKAAETETSKDKEKEDELEVL